MVPETARDALKDIIIHLQGHLILNLKVQWQESTFLDVATLQDLSDESQNQAILIMMQLQQRIITSRPVETLKPRPLFHSNEQTQDSANKQITKSDATSPTPSIGLFPAPPPYYNWPTPPQTPTVNDVSSAVGSRSEKRETGRFSSKLSIFSRRPKAEPSMPSGPSERDSYASIVDQHMLHGISGGQVPNVGNMIDAVRRPSSAETLSDRASTHGQDSIYSTESGSILEPDDPQFMPWASSVTGGSTRNNSVHTHRDTISISSQRMGSSPKNNIETVISSMSISQKNFLPCEANKFGGFCKGAWRLQIGDTKKAMEERQRPGGMYSANGYWQCKKCSMQGRMVVHDKKRKGYDTKVLVFSEGIQFRWVFLFKSHVETKDASTDPSQATFGCTFCCAEGRGTPIFGGVQTFMNHLQEHRDRPPTGEVLYRMNCIVGRRAELGEDFDINLMARIVEDF